MATHNIFKDKINDLAGTKQLGKDESALIRMKRVFENADARAQARQPISLTDAPVTLAGYLAKGPVFAVATYAGKKFVESPQGIKLGSNAILKGSDLLSAKVNLPHVPGANLLYPSSRAGARFSIPESPSMQYPQSYQKEDPRAYQQSSTYPPIIPSPTSTQNELAKQYNIWSQSLKPKPLTEQEKQMRKRLGM
jgi:hypothetical protein